MDTNAQSLLEQWRLYQRAQVASELARQALALPEDDRAASWQLEALQAYARCDDKRVVEILESR